MTKREQVEAALRARGLVEGLRGDWRGAREYVRLDIAHSPDTAWYNEISYYGIWGPREEIAYDDLLRRLS